METYIPASSPLITVTPCATCPEVEYVENGSGGYSAELAGGSMALSFTGTGIMLNHTMSPQYSLGFTVNGSTIDPVSPLSNTGTSTSITEFALPYGRHDFVMAVTSNTTGTEGTNSVVHGCIIETGMIARTSTTDVTIDDTAWRTGQITLTEGWNMLETPVENSNYIDIELVSEELPTLDNDSERSVSFTQRAGSSMSITFEGQAVWAYGISGGEAGMYGIQLDDGLMQVVNAAGGPRSYGSLLYMATDLASGKHTLTFTNIEGGKQFSFDRLVTMDGLSFAAQTPVTSSTPSASSSSTPTDAALTLRPDSSSTHTSTSDGGHEGHALPDIERGGPLSTAAIAGVSVAVIGIVTVLGFMLYWFWLRYRRRIAQEAKKRTTFLHMPDNQRDRKHFSRVHSPNEKDEQYRDDPEQDHIRFPGLRALPLRQGRDGELKRKKSFLDMDITVQVEPESATSGDRRLMPLNHANTAGESPLTELVRYSPHDPPLASASTFETTYGRHHPQRPSDGASQMTGLSAGTGMILPPNLGSTTAPVWSPRPSGPGGAF